MSAVKKETSNGPVYQMSGGFRYPSHITPSKGSYLKIQKDGSISYQNPNCLKDAAPGSKPFHMPVLKPRADKPGETVARLKAMIDKSVSKKPRTHPEAFINRPAYDGLRIVATDGCVALLDRGPAAGEHCDIFDTAKSRAKLVCSILDPEFHLALKRAALMANPRTRALHLFAANDQLVISSSHEAEMALGNDAGDFEETLDCSTEGSESWYATLDYRYLEPMCGSFPLFVWYTGPTHPVIFESAKGDWQYIVMPIADDWEPPAAEVPVNANVSEVQELETVSI